MPNLTNIALVETNPGQYRIVGKRTDGLNFSCVGTYEEMVETAFVNGYGGTIEVYDLSGYPRRVMLPEMGVENA